MTYDVYDNIEAVIRPEAIVATNTSNDVAKTVDDVDVAMVNGYGVP